MGGDVSIMVNRGVTVVSELYRWLKDLLRMRLIDLVHIRNELFKKLAETQVYIHNIVFSLNKNDLKDVSHNPTIILYLYDEETYPDLIKAELNMSCEVFGDETALNGIKPNVTVLDFVRAFALMDEEYIETIDQIRSSAPKEKDTILDKAIATLWRNELTEMNVGDYFIVFDLDRNFGEFNVNVAKGPFWCTYTLRRHHTLRFAVDLFKKYIGPLINTQTNATMG